MTPNKRSTLITVGVVLFAVAFLVLKFPPFKLPELAFVFAVPMLIWGVYYKGSQKKTFLYLWASSWLGGIITIIWLRHVSWLAVIVGAGYGSLYYATWYLVAIRSLKKSINFSSAWRVSMVLGLAGFWVVLEWIRTYFFSGLPWLTLSVSQWKRPVMLELAAWTGGYGISFVIILLNLGLASFFVRKKRSHCVELYLPIVILVGLIIYFAKNLHNRGEQEKVFTAAIVQPDMAPSLKWDQAMFQENLNVLSNESMKLYGEKVDIVIWPETALPACVNEECWTQLWLINLVRDIEVPFLIGTLAEEKGTWFNIILEVQPETRLDKNYYAKRKIVPFGEYVPFRKWLPFISKIVPVDFDLVPGKSDRPLDVEIKDKKWKVGGLICYEDIFPDLARASVAAGAELLLVLTNDAWYGREGAAYQHAAHSVIRAVETRRPLIRVGNNGWSGWIDEYGRIREVATDQNNSIYFRGNSKLTVMRDKKWENQQSFYVKYGDWFVGFCLILVLLMMFVLKTKNLDEV